MPTSNNNIALQYVKEFHDEDNETEEYDCILILIIIIVIIPLL